MHVCLAIVYDKCNHAAHTGKRLSRPIYAVMPPLHLFSACRMAAASCCLFGLHPVSWTVCLCDSYHAFSGSGSYWCSGRILAESVYMYSPKAAGC